MKNCDKLVLALVLGIGTSWASMAGDARSVWTPGLTYHTLVQYDFSVTNATINLKEDPEKSYRTRGAFHTPCFAFSVGYEFWTVNVKRDGNNFYAVRNYNVPAVTMVGGDKIKWKTSNWSLVPRWNMWRDDDVSGLRELIKKSAKNGGVVSEEFSVFDLISRDGHFNETNNSLFFKWTDLTLDEFIAKGATEGFKIRIGNRDEDMRAMTNMQDADNEVSNVIRSEWGISAAGLFGTYGEDAVKREGKKKIIIDASRLRGLLCGNELQKMIGFSGKLIAEVRQVPVSKIREKFPGNTAFDAVSVQVTESEDFRLGFDIGDDYNEWIAANIGVEDNNGGSIEFWVDIGNNALRYARIHIKNDDYKGSLPNPGLGRMLRKVKGNVQGIIVFDCELRTEVSRSIGMR